MACSCDVWLHDGSTWRNLADQVTEVTIERGRDPDGTPAAGRATIRLRTDVGSRWPPVGVAISGWIVVSIGTTRLFTGRAVTDPHWAQPHEGRVETATVVAQDLLSQLGAQNHTWGYPSSLPGIAAGQSTQWIAYLGAVWGITTDGSHHWMAHENSMLSHLLDIRTVPTRPGSFGPYLYYYWATGYWPQPTTPGPPDGPPIVPTDLYEVLPGPFSRPIGFQASATWDKQLTLAAWLNIIAECTDSHLWCTVEGFLRRKERLRYDPAAVPVMTLTDCKPVTGAPASEVQVSELGDVVTGLDVMTNRWVITDAGDLETIGWDQPSTARWGLRNMELDTPFVNSVSVTSWLFRIAVYRAQPQTRVDGVTVIRAKDHPDVAKLAALKLGDRVNLERREPPDGVPRHTAGELLAIGWTIDAFTVTAELSVYPQVTRPVSPPLPPSGSWTTRTVTMPSTSTGSWRPTPPPGSWGATPASGNQGDGLGRRHAIWWFGTWFAPPGAATHVRNISARVLVSRGISGVTHPPRWWGYTGIARPTGAPTQVTELGSALGASVAPSTAATWHALTPTIAEGLVYGRATAVGIQPDFDGPSGVATWGSSATLEITWEEST